MSLGTGFLPKPWGWLFNDNDNESSKRKLEEARGERKQEEARGSQRKPKLSLKPKILLLPL